MYMKLHKVNLEKLSSYIGWYVQIKYDGVFVALHWDGDTVQAYSRTGKPFFQDVNRIRSVRELAKQLQGRAPAVLLAELTSTRCSLEVLSGLVNPNRKADWTLNECEMLGDAVLHLHDYLPSDMSEGTVVREAYAVRYAALQAAVRDTNVLRVVQSTFVQDTRDLCTLYDNTCQAGYEGLVLKDPAAGYSMGKRSRSQLKWVRQHSEDLQAVDVVMGKGKREGMIGALVFQKAGSTFNADLGAGWADAGRAELTREYLHGDRSKVLCVWEVQGLQPSSTGKAIRLPKAIRRRLDL